MEGIKIFKKIATVKPTMIAGWPGMGNVALGAVEYLKKALDATRFAEITMDRMTLLDGMIVEDGAARFPEPPKSSFYYSKDKDILIFEGEVQLPGEAGVSLMNKVLDMAKELNVARIYTGAAFVYPMSHKDQSEVFAVYNKPPLRDFIVKAGIKLMEGGQISGLNGLLLGFAEKRGIEAFCLLATIPQYAISIPNPKASRAIMEVLSRLLNFEVDYHGINLFIKDMDEKMAMIEDKVKDIFPGQEHKQDFKEKDKHIPAYVMERIEKLFEEAKLDKKKAINLKRELDRWDLYKMYEDRFLDLFKDNQ